MNPNDYKAAHNEWIGVDFDGTLATYEDGMPPGTLGRPIAPMVERVKAWLAAGEDVRIMTARVHPNPERDPLLWGPVDAAEARVAIQKWCLQHLGRVLPVQCHKDGRMRELWDDRARRVEFNTGVSQDEEFAELKWRMAGLEK